MDRYLRVGQDGLGKLKGITYNTKNAKLVRKNLEIIQKM